MTDDEAKALGLRALAAGFVPNDRCWEGQYWAAWYVTGGHDGDSWPDLRDAATRGVLLEQVRRARRDPFFHVTPWDGGWLGWDHPDGPSKDPVSVVDPYMDQAHPTEIHALVAALEAARRKV